MIAIFKIKKKINIQERLCTSWKRLLKINFKKKSFFWNRHCLKSVITLLESLHLSTVWICSFEKHRNVKILTPSTQKPLPFHMYGFMAPVPQDKCYTICLTPTNGLVRWYRFPKPYKNNRYPRQTIWKAPHPNDTYRTFYDFLFPLNFA